MFSFVKLVDVDQVPLSAVRNVSPVVLHKKLSADGRKKKAVHKKMAGRSRLIQFDPQGSPSLPLLSLIRSDLCTKFTSLDAS